MKSVSKANEERLQIELEHVGAMRKLLDDAIELANACMADDAARVNEAREGYAEAIERLQEAVADIGAEIADHVDGKSERWQESDRGQAFAAWRDAWQECELTVPDEYEAAEFDALDAGDVDGVVADLPREPEI